MEKKLIGFNYEGKRRKIEVYKVPKWFEGIGLMFSRRKKAKILLFEFKKPVKMAIHSYFVFFPFLAIWLDSKNKVLDLKIVKPFKIGVLPSEKFTRLIEIPLSVKCDFLEIPSIKRKI